VRWWIPTGDVRVPGIEDSKRPQDLTPFSFTGQGLPFVGLFQSPLLVCAAWGPLTLRCEVPDGTAALPSG
jgi:hypothetical protein